MSELLSREELARVINAQYKLILTIQETAHLYPTEHSSPVIKRLLNSIEGLHLLVTIAKDLSENSPSESL